MAASIVFKALFTWQICMWFLAPTCILHLNPQGIRIPLFVMEIRIAGKKSLVAHPSLTRIAL